MMFNNHIFDSEKSGEFSLSMNIVITLLYNMLLHVIYPLLKDFEVFALIHYFMHLLFNLKLNRDAWARISSKNTGFGIVLKKLL